MTRNDLGGPLHPSLLEAASWRLCSELARRHPATTRIVELHPGGGQYDCLAVVPADGESGAALHVNRLGSIHVGPGDASWGWDRYLSAADVKSFLREIERAMELRSPSSVPSATPATLSWRLIASSLAQELLTPSGLRAVNGMLDSSGDGGPRDALFTRFPAADRRRRVAARTDLLGRSEYWFWFLLRGTEPLIAIESDTGHSWWIDGTERALMDEYRTSGRRLGATAAHALAPAWR